MDRLWCCLLVVAAFLLTFVSPESKCRPTSIVPGFQPLAPHAVLNTSRISRVPSPYACSALCCAESCTLAYLRQDRCVRLTCPDEKRCRFRKSLHPDVYLIFPMKGAGDEKAVSCLFETPSGCGLNEHCTDKQDCACTAGNERNEHGVCAAPATPVEKPSKATHSPMAHRETVSAAGDHEGHVLHHSTVAKQLKAESPVVGTHSEIRNLEPAPQASTGSKSDAAIKTSESAKNTPSETSQSAENSPSETGESNGNARTSVVTKGEGAMGPPQSAHNSQAATSVSADPKGSSKEGKLLSHPAPPAGSSHEPTLPGNQEQPPVKDTQAKAPSDGIETVVLNPKTPPAMQSPNKTLPPAPHSKGPATDSANDTTVAAQPTAAKQPAAPADTISPAAPVSTKNTAVQRRMSVGQDRKITLPTNKVSLFASFYPRPSAEELTKFEFEWTFVSGPNEGQIGNPHSPTTTLSDLIVGEYKVHLKAQDALGQGYVGDVNITVLPKPRVNRPPVAVVHPNSVKVQFPQSSVVLDGTQSHDEFDKTLKYNWIEVSWPFGRTLKEYGETDRSVLSLSNLGVGDYRLKLIVTDSDDAEGSTLVNITVLPEKDDAPVARAGQPKVIQLPVNSVWLFGNSSSDDKGIDSYIWTKEKGPDGNDQSGASSPNLHLTSLPAGDYMFQLRVTDKAGQSATSKVSVVVKPANEEPPHVDAGNDMSSVSRSIDIVGRAWMDEEENGCLKCTYRWSKVKTPKGDRSRLAGNATLNLHIDQLVAGEYVLRLTAASSRGKKASSDITLTIQNAADVDKPPSANAGSDVTIRLPNHMAMLDGQLSSDPDDEIQRWLWKRSAESPAVGDIANGSDITSTLKLSNLVEGTYSFELTVYDTFGKSSSDSALVRVLPAAFSLRHKLFEIEIQEPASDFMENEKSLLVNNVANALGFASSAAVQVYAIDSRLGKVSLAMQVVEEGEEWTAADAVKQLRKSLDSLNVDVKHSTVTVERIDTFYCLNNCSNHGACEPLSKQCICETLWMQNPFRAHFGNKIPNCDWNLLYVAIVNMAILAGSVLSCVCFYQVYQRCSKTKLRVRGRRQKGYSVLKRAQSDEDTSIAMLPQASARSDIRSHSDSEELIFDTGALLKSTNGSKPHTQTNGKAHHLTQ